MFGGVSDFSCKYTHGTSTNGGRGKATVRTTVRTEHPEKHSVTLVKNESYLRGLWPLLFCVWFQEALSKILNFQLSRLDEGKKTLIFCCTFHKINKRSSILSSEVTYLSQEANGLFLNKENKLIFIRNFLASLLSIMISVTISIKDR